MAMLQIIQRIPPVWFVSGLYYNLNHFDTGKYVWTNDAKYTARRHFLGIILV